MAWACPFYLNRLILASVPVGMSARAQAARRVLSCAGMCAQVEQLQAQVRVLQAVGYGALETDDAGGPGPGAADSLEAALLKKARRLEHDLTMARLRMAELAGMTPLATPNDLPDACMFVARHAKPVRAVRRTYLPSTVMEALESMLF